MSGRIRSSLGVALKTLRNHVHLASQLLRQEMSPETTNKLRMERNHLQTSLVRVEEYNRQWHDFIDSRQDDARDAEELIYNNFPPRARAEAVDGEPTVEDKHFLEQCEVAREVITIITATLMEQQSGTSSRQSLVGGNEAADHGDFADEDAAVSIELGANARSLPRRVFQQPATTVRPAPPPRVKLPPLRLPSFSGDPKDWSTFWQMFSSTVDSEPSYDNILKMSHLLSLLEKPVRSVVAGYLPTNENYPRVVELLKRRYGDPRALKESLQSELCHLPAAGESIASLRQFHDVVERVCRQLADHGIKDDAWVVFAVKERLPQATLAKLIEKERKTGQDWDSNSWRKELDQLISVSEEVQRYHGGREEDLPPRREMRLPFKPHPETTRSFLATNQSRRSGSNQRQTSSRHCPETTRSFATTDQSRNPGFNQSHTAGRQCCEMTCSFATTDQSRSSGINQRTTSSRRCSDKTPSFATTDQSRCPGINQSQIFGRPCSLCEGPHLPSKCPKYNNPKARRVRLKEQNRCVTCLRDAHHRINDCPSTRRCTRCNGRHHFIVCFSRDINATPKQKLNQPTKWLFKPPTSATKPPPIQGPTQIHSVMENQQMAKHHPDIPAIVAASSIPQERSHGYLMTKKLPVMAEEERTKSQCSPSTTPTASQASSPADWSRSPILSEAPGWTSKGQSSTVYAMCSTMVGRTASECSLCIDHIANPHGQPQWATILIGIVMCTALAFCCTCLCVLRACGANIRTAYSILHYAVGCGVLSTRFAKRKSFKAYEKADKAYAFNPRLQAKRRLADTNLAVRDAGREWRLEHLNRIVSAPPRRYVPALVAVTLCILALVDSCRSTTIALVTKSECCKRGSKSLEANAEFATTMTFLPCSQHNRLLLRDKHGVVLGTFLVVTDALTVDCIPLSEGWTRAYTLRNPAKARPDTMVPKLKDANSQRGVPCGEASSSFWLTTSVSPRPVLYNHFVTDGDRIAMITQQLSQNLHCSTKEEARAFNGTLDPAACTDCLLHHGERAATCICRDVDIESLINETTAQLPLNVQRIQLRNEHRRVFAELGYPPVKQHAQMVDLFTSTDQPRSRISPANQRSRLSPSESAQLPFTSESAHSPLCRISSVHSRQANPLSRHSTSNKHVAFLVWTTPKTFPTATKRSRLCALPTSRTAKKNRPAERR